MNIEVIFALTLALYQGDLSNLSDCEPRRRAETITQTQQRLVVRYGVVSEVTMREHFRAVEGGDERLETKGLTTGLEPYQRPRHLTLVRVSHNEGGEWVCVLQQP